jgi:hypothetical protein
MDSKYAPTGVWERLLPERKTAGSKTAPKPDSKK